MHIVTGTCESRLLEIKKYAVNGGLNVQYFTSNSINIDGLDLSLTTTGSTASTYTYYIGGIKYIDTITPDLTTTTFEFVSLGYNDPNNFEYQHIIKLNSKENMIENPQVNSDVFIVRQQQSVFEKNYRLRGIGSLNDIISYAGGNYFTIYNNS